jgi:hypothetical protein
MQCRTHRIGRVRLAHGNQSNGVRPAVRGTRRGLDATAHTAQIGGNGLFHVGSIPGTRLAQWETPHRFGCGAKGFAMFVRYYGLLLGVAASLSLILAGCGSDDSRRMDPATGARPRQPVQQGPVDDTDQTIFTVLGLGKRQSQQNFGPQTGSTVSPELWMAAHDSLDFAGIKSEDAVTGLMVTDWYSPRGKPNERLRISVFILSRALRSDSLSVTVDRQERASTGQWRDTPVSRDTVTGLETAILQRARQIHAERYRGDL